ncbi:MAG TPA: tRNA (adenosine(37)-N6)-dimethylallyltransferase MiaA [Bacillota bacterium]|nr:tRNA (adenosine(37)-N6)-dimethylallyltransferase MiaA [Bacillota bacterium]HPT88135.1 tRNA (adenosine(37)-N6)-dimethylallyltransferase MiaA [Bacillota bacterium]
MERPIIIIAGPTAVGKTDFAIWLAEQLNTEIISADSMQVYKYMDIGTAKPDAPQQQRVKHHLIDLVRPDQSFSVADYQQLFDKTVDDFKQKGRIPLVVGGTGLYIRASIQSFALDNSAQPDPELRHRYKELLQTYGNEYLHRKLTEVDPEAAARIHPNDAVRIIRALEVFELTGTPISKLQTKHGLKYPVIYIFLDRNREELYDRINRRVELMLEQGLLEEVKSLLNMGFSADLKPMQGLGYKQLVDYLENRLTFDEAIDQMKQKTRNYAKRQITWFKREPLDYSVNLSGKKEEFYYEILNYIEGRLG